MNKECSVVMLPSKAITAPVEPGLYINAISLFVPHRFKPHLTFEKYMNGMNVPNPQHLYITSDEEIKLGDWYHTGARTVDFGVHNADTQRLVDISNEHGAKRIISTTDPELNLSRPSNEFIQAYCKAGGIDKVMVEYYTWPIGPNGNIIGTDKPYPYDSLTCNFIIKETLKVAPDNTITIHPVTGKTQFSRDEVLNIIVEAFVYDYHSIEDPGIRPRVEQWFNTHY